MTTTASIVNTIDVRWYARYVRSNARWSRIASPGTVRVIWFRQNVGSQWLESGASRRTSEGVFDLESAVVEGVWSSVASWWLEAAENESSNVLEPEGMPCKPRAVLAELVVDD